MKSRIHLKLLMAPLSMLTLFACSPNQFQQTSEYDDVYFTSADRQKAPKIITKPGSATGDLSQVITLENRSSKSVDKELLTKYTNNTPSETEYFVDGEVEPKVKKANQLNYDDFVSDYENEMLATYALPLDWETEWDANYFNNLVYNDFEFKLAWYEQYYVGDSDRMDRYINASTGRVGNSVYSDFNRSRIIANSFYPGVFRPRLGISVGFGFGNGFGLGFGNGFYDPFYDSFYDPFFYRSSFRRNGWNRWNRGFGSFGGFGGFYDPYIYCPPIYSNQYIYRGDVIVARNDRTYTRGGRLQSSSVSSVRSDATNGVAPTRSQRLSSTSGTRSSVSRSAIASRSERNSGRVRSSSSSGVTSSRSSSRSTSSTVPSTRSTRSSRTSTDAYRFDESSRSSRSSNVRANATSGRSAVTSRTARSSSSTSRASTNRSSSNRSSSGPSFNRSSSRSTSGVSRSSSSRSSSTRGVSRSSSSRSSSSRSSGVRSSGSSSRSTSGSVSKGRSSSSRSGSSSRSSSTSSSRSSSSSSSKKGSSSSSSRSGRGN